MGKDIVEIAQQKSGIGFELGEQNNIRRFVTENICCSKRLPAVAKRWR